MWGAEGPGRNLGPHQPRRSGSLGADPPEGAGSPQHKPVNRGRGVHLHEVPGQLLGRRRRAPMGRWPGTGCSSPPGVQLAGHRPLGGGVLDLPHHKGQTSAHLPLSHVLAASGLGRALRPLVSEARAQHHGLLSVGALGFGTRVWPARQGALRGTGPQARPHRSVGLRPLTGLPHLCKSFPRRLANDVSYETPNAGLREGELLCARAGCLGWRRLLSSPYGTSPRGYTVRPHGTSQ